MAVRRKTQIIEGKGKPGRMAFQVTPEIVGNLEAAAGLGLNLSEICTALSISYHTLQKYARSTDDNMIDDNGDNIINAAIARGRYKAVLAVSNTLYNKALNGDTIAMIFFLKNRAPAQWSDNPRPETDLTLKEAQDAKQLLLDKLSSLAPTKRTTSVPESTH